MAYGSKIFTKYSSVKLIYILLDRILQSNIETEIKYGERLLLLEDIAATRNSIRRSCFFSDSYSII